MPYPSSRHHDLKSRAAILHEPQIISRSHTHNKTSLAPPGTKIIVHENPNQRRTWVSHGVEGWYLGTSPEHYRCHRTYITKTRKERITRTVEFYPHNHNMPTTLSAKAAIVVSQNLVHALQNPVPPTPYFIVCTEQADALVTLSQLFLKRNTTTTRIAVPAPRVAVLATLRPPRVPLTRRLPPMQPPRVHLTTIWAPSIPTPMSHALSQPLQPGPHLVEPNPDKPVCHR